MPQGRNMDYVVQGMFGVNDLGEERRKHNKGMHSKSMHMKKKKKKGYGSHKVNKIASHFGEAKLGY